MTGSARRISNAVIAAIRESGVDAAIESGAPAKMEFSVVIESAKGAMLTAKCELDLTGCGTVGERMRVGHRCYQDAVEKLVAAERAADAAVVKAAEKAADDAERAKVARCNTCNRWFPSYQARNEHRESHRAPPPAEPAREQTLILRPDAPPPARGPDPDLGGLVGF